jgi:hypothetical protein
MDGFEFRLLKMGDAIVVIIVIMCAVLLFIWKKTDATVHP